MVRLRRVEPESSVYRDAYLRTLSRRRVRWSYMSKVDHSHGSRTMVASIESLDAERTCLGCGARRRLELIDRLIADVEAGRPVVDDGPSFGVPHSGGELYVLEADGTVTRVTVVHVDDTVLHQRPDGSLVERPTKARTRTTRSH